MKNYSINNEMVQINDEGYVFTVKNKLTDKCGSGKNHNGGKVKYFATHHDNETSDSLFIGKKKESIEYVLNGLGLPKYDKLVKCK